MYVGMYVCTSDVCVYTYISIFQSECLKVYSLDHVAWVKICRSPSSDVDQLAGLPTRALGSCFQSVALKDGQSDSSELRYSTTRALMIRTIFP